jgi:hypothetical protein
MPYLIALNFEKEITLFFFTIALFISCTHDDKPYTTWAVYRGDKESTGYSALNQEAAVKQAILPVMRMLHFG